MTRAFGTGWNHPYDILPVGSRNPYTYIDILMPDGFGIHYERVSEGTGYSDAVYEHTATATPFLHSEFRWNGGGWDLRFPDGGLFLFPENYSGTRANQGAPTAMRDGSGHEIVFQRDSGRNLEQLTSSSGRVIRFEHDARSRVVAASDDRGHVVRYVYDAGGRLAGVSSKDRALRYQYQDTDLVAIDDASGPVLRVHHDATRRVSRIDLRDGRSFRFAFTLDDAGDHVVEAVVEAPDGTATRVPGAPAR